MQGFPSTLNTYVLKVSVSSLPQHQAWRRNDTLQGVYQAQHLPAGAMFFYSFRIPPHLIILSWSYATTTSGKTKIKTPSSPSSLQSLLTRPSQVFKFSSGRRSTWTRQVCVRFWRNGPTLPLITGSFLKRTARTLDVATFKESTIRVFHFWFDLKSY